MTSNDFWDWAGELLTERDISEIEKALINESVFTKSWLSKHGDCNFIVDANPAFVTMKIEPIQH